MSKINKIIYLFISTLFFAIVNSYFSNLIINNEFLLSENPIFDILLIQNQGAAFNLFEGYRVFLILFSIAAVLILITYTIKYIQRISTICLFFISILCAGIFCNMTERFLLGYVRDFIKLNFIDFPVFNISDIYINIGVFGIILIILYRSYIKKQGQ